MYCRALQPRRRPVSRPAPIQRHSPGPVSTLRQTRLTLLLRVSRRYQQQKLAEAISSFEASLALTPKPKGSQDPNDPIPVMTPERVVLGDTYTNLGAA